jgi:hypothetical protein
LSRKYVPFGIGISQENDSLSMEILTKNIKISMLPRIVTTFCSGKSKNNHCFIQNPKDDMGIPKKMTYFWGNPKEDMGNPIFLVKRVWEFPNCFGKKCLSSLVRWEISNFLKICFKTRNSQVF